MPIELPPLPYDHAALEPHIGRRTLEIHHGKHHAKYVATTNTMSKRPTLPRHSYRRYIILLSFVLPVFFAYALIFQSLEPSLKTATSSPSSRVSYDISRYCGDKFVCKESVYSAVFLVIMMLNDQRQRQVETLACSTTLLRCGTILSTGTA